MKNLKFDYLWTYLNNIWLSMKKIKTLFYYIFSILILSLVWFWIHYTQNTQFEIRQHYKKELAWSSMSLLNWEKVKQYSFWYSKVIWDKYWIDTILYTGENAFWTVYKKAIEKYLEVVVALNPKFYEIYPVSINLLNNFSVEKAIEYGTIWMENSCDEDKVLKILNNKDLTNINNLELTEDWFKFKKEFWEKYKDLKNPCKNWETPYTLAWIYLIGKTYKSPTELQSNQIKAYQFFSITMMHEDAWLGSLWLVLSFQGAINWYMSAINFWKDTLDLAKKNKSSPEQLQQYDIKYKRSINLYEISNAFEKSKDKKENNWNWITDINELIKKDYLDKKFIIDPFDTYLKESLSEEEQKNYENKITYYYNKNTKQFENITTYDYNKIINSNKK